MRHILIWVAVLMGSAAESPLWSQAYFYPGWVLTAQGDTLYGEIDYRNRARACSSLVYRAHKEAPVREFKPADVRACAIGSTFRFETHQVTLPGDSSLRPVLMELVFSGRMVIHAYEDRFQTVYFASLSGEPPLPLPFREEIIRTDGKDMRMRTKDHQQILGFLVRDCDAATKAVAEMNQLQLANLIKLAGLYESCGAPSEGAQRSIPKTVFWLEPAYSQFIFLPEGGFLLHFDTPWSGGRVQPAVGLSYLHDLGLRMPLIAYYTPNYRFLGFRMGLGGVVNFRKSELFNFRLEPGIQVQVSERIRVNAAAGADLFFFIANTANYFPVYARIGCAIRL